jgi:hypothetical protein
MRVLLTSVLLLIAGCADDSDRALPSEVAVVVEVSGCRNLLEYGGGSFIAADRVLTSAHVVGGQLMSPRSIQTSTSRCWR